MNCCGNCDESKHGKQEGHQAKNQGENSTDFDSGKKWLALIAGLVALLLFANIIIALIK